MKKLIIVFIFILLFTACSSKKGSEPSRGIKNGHIEQEIKKQNKNTKKTGDYLELFKQDKLPILREFTLDNVDFYVSIPSDKGVINGKRQDCQYSENASFCDDLSYYQGKTCGWGQGEIDLEFDYTCLLFKKEKENISLVSEEADFQKDPQIIDNKYALTEIWWGDDCVTGATYLLFDKNWQELQKVKYTNWDCGDAHEEKIYEKNDEYRINFFKKGVDFEDRQVESYIRLSKLEKCEKNCHNFFNAIPLYQSQLSENAEIEFDVLENMFNGKQFEYKINKKKYEAPFPNIKSECLNKSLKNGKNLEKNKLKKTLYKKFSAQESDRPNYWKKEEGLHETGKNQRFLSQMEVYENEAGKITLATLNNVSPSGDSAVKTTYYFTEIGNLFFMHQELNTFHSDPSPSFVHTYYQEACVYGPQRSKPLVFDINNQYVPEPNYMEYESIIFSNTEMLLEYIGPITIDLTKKYLEKFGGSIEKKGLEFLGVSFRKCLKNNCSEYQLDDGRIILSYNDQGYIRSFGFERQSGKKEFLDDYDNGYIIENNKIFYHGHGLDKEIKEADAASFKGLVGEYPAYFTLGEFAVDKNYVYQSAKILPEADPETFEVLGNSTYGFQKDKNHVYRQGKILEGINPETFEFWACPANQLRCNYYKDKNGVYMESVGGIRKFPYDPTTFSFYENSFYIQESGKVYSMSEEGEYGFTLISEADLVSFEIIPCSADSGGKKFCVMGYTNLAKDKNRVYFEEKIISGADPKTFNPEDFDFNNLDG